MSFPYNFGTNALRFDPVYAPFTETVGGGGNAAEPLPLVKKTAKNNRALFTEAELEKLAADRNKRANNQNSLLQNAANELGNLRVDEKYIPGSARVGNQFVNKYNRPAFAIEEAAGKEIITSIGREYKYKQTTVGNQVVEELFTKGGKLWVEKTAIGKDVTINRYDENGKLCEIEKSDVTEKRHKNGRLKESKNSLKIFDHDSNLLRSDITTEKFDEDGRLAKTEIRLKKYDDNRKLLQDDLNVYLYSYDYEGNMFIEELAKNK